MERRAFELYSHLNREVKIRVIPGHFATKHSHISHCIDMTEIKSQLSEAKKAAEILAHDFAAVPMDTIISLDRMKMVGAFMADCLSGAGVNARQNIAVLTPELTDGKMVLRDNFKPYVYGRRVLILTASATTGQTVNDAARAVVYYGGAPVGIAAIFGGEFECELPVKKLFGVEDIAGYSSYSLQSCPLCRRGVKVDAVVNSYGYSKL